MVYKYSFSKLLLLLLFFIYPFTYLISQQVMMQGWYWDYPKTASGAQWSDTLLVKVADLKDAGFTHMWLPPHTISASGTYSNGYDPQDLFIGNQTSGFATRAALNGLLAAMNAQELSPVADLVLNHRDGGKAESNPAVEGYVENYNAAKFNAGDNPFPSDRFRCILPLGGSSNNGAGNYYFKLSSASGVSDFNGYGYKLYMQTKRVGWQNLPADNEDEPNGGGDCDEDNKTIMLGRDYNAQVETVTGCNTDEFHLNLGPDDFFAAGDTLEIYITNTGGYSDHRFYGIWSQPRGADIINDLRYQTYTDFSGLPSGRGDMNWECFKPNGNPTGLSGDWDSMDFFYDYDQNTDCVLDTLFEWARWNIATLGMKGFRLDAVKHFPPYFVGDMLDYLYDQGTIPNIVVGESYSTNTAELSGWVNDVLGAMNQATRDAISPKIFDFSLRENLRQACDVPGFDSRNVFLGGLADNGLSGFNVVTFANNHDFRDASGFASLIDNDVLLAYAYLFTNNKLGVPCVFYPDYFGYFGEAGTRSVSPPLVSEINQLIDLLQTYVNNAEAVNYLNRFGTPYTATYVSGSSDKALIYQLTNTSIQKDIIVAINFSEVELDVLQNIDMTDLATGTEFTDILGRSSGDEVITIDGSTLHLHVPARSYATWVQGNLPQIPLPITLLDFRAVRQDQSVRINMQFVDENNMASIDLEKSGDSKQFHTLTQLNLSDVKAGNEIIVIDDHPAQKNYYRLKMTDLDGKVQYSEVRQVLFQQNLELVNTLTGGNLKLQGHQQHMKYVVSDIHGNQLMSGQVPENGLIDVGYLSSGLYVLTVHGILNPANFKFIRN